jgi:hypothetical protein
MNTRVSLAVYTLRVHLILVEFGRLTIEFLLMFKVWLSRQDESQAEIARRPGI